MANRSVIKAFSIIEYLAENGASPLVQVARALRLNHATAYRFLVTLRTLGYVRQRGSDGHYQLTMRFASIANSVLESLELRSAARPYLEQVANDSRLTSHLAVLEDDTVVYIDRYEQPDSAVSLRTHVGKREALHSTAPGKVILASLNVSERMALLDRIVLDAHTQATITERNDLERHLATVRASGYAIDDEEGAEGIRGVAVPVIGANGRTVAAMSLSGWTVSVTHDRLTRLATLLLAAGSALSAELGYVMPVRPAETQTDVPGAVRTRRQRSRTPASARL